eukprot:4848414-Karenia_brevis.AAC.1
MAKEKVTLHTKCLAVNLTRHAPDSGSTCILGLHKTIPKIGVGNCLGLENSILEALGPPKI